MDNWPLRADPWGYRLLFVALALLFLFIKLLPLGSLAGAFPGPDLLLALMIAWVMRRPDVLPIWLILAVVLTEDLLLMRPPGLWTAIVVLATEFLRSRIALTRELSLPVEWLLASGLMIAMLMLNRLAFTVSLLPQAPFGFAVTQVVWTIIAYPLLVFLSRLWLDIRKTTTGKLNESGRGL